MLEFKNKLYVITDEKLMKRRDFVAQARETIAAGAGIIQLREKFTLLRDRLAVAKALSKLAKKHGVKFVVNDDPWLAQMAGADGVHLGREDAPVEAARELLGKDAIIGVSCYGDLKRALEMERQGASYVSFGAFYPSPTKPKEPVVPTKIITQAKQILHVPVVAIGGITVENSAPLLQAGADSIAVISSIFGKPDAAKTAGKFQEVIKNENKHD